MSPQSQPSGELRFKVQVWIYRALPQGGFEVLLLLLRPERGGFWQPVTGGVEPGETVERAALREATEETQLPFRGGPVPLDYRFRFEGRGGLTFEEHVFALEALGAEVRLDPREHVDRRWVTAEAARREILPALRHPSNAEGLRRLLELLRGKSAGA